MRRLNVLLMLMLLFVSLTVAVSRSTWARSEGSTQVVGEVVAETVSPTPQDGTREDKDPVKTGDDRYGISYLLLMITSCLFCVIIGYRLRQQGGMS